MQVWYLTEIFSTVKPLRLHLVEWCADYFEVKSFDRIRQLIMHTIRWFSSHSRDMAISFDLPKTMKVNKSPMSWGFGIKRWNWMAETEMGIKRWNGDKISWDGDKTLKWVIKRRVGGIKWLQKTTLVVWFRLSVFILSIFLCQFHFYYMRYQAKNICKITTVWVYVVFTWWWRTQQWHNYR